ncbi:PTS sugar transporter subunit IIB [Oscillospiraceae bacterium MB08-C2-2]|nr:PTS sugar transporter subunit IIB [Oscillospiraceae bacterium MB08-C2-2]
MADKNLVFTRIDDRLIHGQVCAAWLRAYSNVEHIMVIDDKVSQDAFMQQMFQMLVPTGITIEIIDIATAEGLLKAGLKKPTMVIVKVPDTLKQLMDDGVEIPKVNIGGMGMSAGRKKFFQNISTTPAENDIFREMVSKGVVVEIQIIPAAKTVNVANLLK